MDNEKLDAVTTFKLTVQMSSDLDTVAGREACTKDAAIRKLIRWGLLVDSELQALTGVVAKRIATRELKAVPAESSAGSERAIKGGRSRR